MRGGGRAELVSLPLRGRGGVGVGFQSVGSDVETLPRRNPSPPKPSGPAQRAGRSFGPRGSAAQADRPHPLEGEGFKARSEEHTSELPSLMRISYAVFCLTKKKQKEQNNIHKSI